MISLLRGTVAGKQAGRVVLDVGGVGYLVAIPVETYSRVGQEGEELTLHVHTHVREQELSLFGFHDPKDKELFEKFIDVSGVGPKMALTLLSGLPRGELVGAILSGDWKALTRAPGVGKKTGQRIILELKDKLKGMAAEAGEDGEAAAVEEDVVSVLVNLGSSPESARRGVRAARRKGAPAEFEALFRLAMASMKR